MFLLCFKLQVACTLQNRFSADRLHVADTLQSHAFVPLTLHVAHALLSTPFVVFTMHVALRCSIILLLCMWLKNYEILLFILHEVFTLHNRCQLISHYLYTLLLHCLWLTRYR